MDPRWRWLPLAIAAQFVAAEPARSATATTAVHFLNPVAQAEWVTADAKNSEAAANARDIAKKISALRSEGRPDDPTEAIAYFEMIARLEADELAAQAASEEAHEARWIVIHRYCDRPKPFDGCPRPTPVVMDGGRIHLP